jgi:alkylation response protein AidB-like acyl-CoA dehydrogenase
MAARYFRASLQALRTVIVDAYSATYASGMQAKELIGRAEELVPVLAERAAKTEELRQVPGETVRDLVDAGLIRVATPERYGGHGVDVDTLFEVGWRLAQGCGATGWFYSVTQSHNWVMGTASEAAQEEYFASPDVISSSAFAPTGRTERVRDGWRVSGRWPFSSGVDHADWVLLGAVDPTRQGQCFLMLPRADITIVDDWFASGLKGTGSKSVVIDEPVFVPEYRQLRVGPARPDCRDRHRRNSYNVPYSQVMPSVLAAPLVGIAQGAVTEYVNHTKRRVIRRGKHQESAATRPGAQFRVAESAAQADTAVAVLRADLLELVDRGARDQALTDLDRARIRRNHCYVTTLSVAAVNRLFDAAGANALLAPSPLARMHRDVNAGSHQVALGWDDSAELYGRVRLGVEPPPALW